MRRIHQQARGTPHSCSFCNDRFKELQQLKKHVLNVHNSDLCYACEICKMQFRLVNELKLHKHEEHGHRMQRRKYMVEQESIVATSDFGSTADTEELFDQCFDDTD